MPRGPRYRQSRHPKVGEYIMAHEHDRHLDIAPLTRRAWLTRVGLVVGAGLLAACAPATPPAAQPTAAPAKPAATTAPAAAPTTAPAAAPTTAPAATPTTAAAAKPAQTTA